MPPPFPIFEKPVVLIDFDDTLAEYDGWKGWRDIGKPRDFAQEFVRYFKKYGWVTVLWSSRAESGYLEEWLHKHGFTDPEYGEGLIANPSQLLIDYIGTHPTPFPMNPAKPIADVIIDNACWPFCGEPVPLREVMADLLSRGILSKHQHASDKRRDDPAAVAGARKTKRKRLTDARISDIPDGRGVD